MSEKTNAELEAIMNADSGYDATTVRAAYKELSKRKDLDFPVQMVTGGRDEKNPDAPPPRPDSIKKKAGGVVKKRIGANDYRKGGYVLSTMDNRKVKRNGK